MAIVKTPTKWIPSAGTGYVVNVGSNFLITNSGNFLTTNSGNFLVTTPIKVVGKYATTWTKTNKITNSWTNASITVGAINNIADTSSNLLVDALGNFVVDSGASSSKKKITTWTGSGL